MNKKIIVILAAVLLVVVLFGLLKNNSSKKSLEKLPSNTESIQTSEAGKQTIPTLSEERKEIISKIETLVVEINEATITPQTLTIKLYDQVSFVNKSSSVISFIGEGWGNVPVGTGENFTQALTLPELFLIRSTVFRHP